jgi:hypothetical protein
VEQQQQVQGGVWLLVCGAVCVKVAMYTREWREMLEQQQQQQAPMLLCCECW